MLAIELTELRAEMMALREQMGDWQFALVSAYTHARVPVPPELARYQLRLVPDRQDESA